MAAEATNTTNPTSAAPRSEAESTRASFPEQDERGVDLSLLRWMLSLTPRERLLEMERNARDTEQLLAYGRKHRQTKAAADR
jgi:hypothetical protein